MDSQPQLPAARSPPPTLDTPERLDLAALTRRMFIGDEDAYRIFCEAYFHRLWRYLLVLTRGDEQSAGEALQATLVRVVRNIKPFSDDAVFWSWLTVLARTALADQSRKRRRYLAFLDRFTEARRIQEALAQPDPASADLLARLDHHLAALPFDERDLLERKYFARESVRDIAAELQTTEKSVESRLVRVRRKLKAALLQSLNHD